MLDFTSTRDIKEFIILNPQEVYQASIMAVFTQSSIDSFENASMRALSVTDPVQDLTAGDCSLGKVSTNMRTLVRGNEDLIKVTPDIGQLVPESQGQRRNHI